MDILDVIWRELRAEINTVSQNTQRTTLQSEEANVSESLPASTLATAPLAVDGGLPDGNTYITMRWISDGRKPGEGAATGTGVLAFYDSVADEWVSVFDQSTVLT